MWYFILWNNNGWLSVSESPSWIKERLEAAGLNSKNSIVDISNYVMLDLGLPNHIFDADKIKGNISINSLKDPCDFVSLDDEKRQLLPGDTVVCDESGLCYRWSYGRCFQQVSQRYIKSFY